MKYLLPTVLILIYMCLETASLPLQRAEKELERCGDSQPGYLPPEILERLEKAVKRKDFKEEKQMELPLRVPPEKVYPPVQNPTDDKATCTSYPGRVVCYLGRYTFVINNGEHKMDPEVLERFAAMIYHRSQEGDSNFKVSVDVPVSINKDYLGATHKSVAESTRSIPEDLNVPVYVECSPIPGDRNMYNPPYTISEVIYSCRQKKLGTEGDGGNEGRMVINVDKEGVVSARDLVLPYSALLTRRFKRRKDKHSAKPEICEPTGNAYWTTHRFDNKLYSSVYAFQQKGWCPSALWSNSPEAYVTVAMKEDMNGNSNDAIKAALSQAVQGAEASPDQLPSLNMGSLQPLSPGQREISPNMAAGQRVIQGSLSSRNPGIITAGQIKDPSFSSLTGNPLPKLNVFRDTSKKMTFCPWCPPNFRPTEYTLSSCVTLEEYAIPANSIESRKRKRQVQQCEKKPSYPMLRHRQNRMRTGRKFRQKRFYNRKRRGQVSNMSTTISLPHISCIFSCEPDTTPQCETQPTIKYGNLSIFGRKQGLKRKQQNTNHIQWPNVSKERYILE